MNNERSNISLKIDDERKDALQRLSKVEAENKNNAVLIAKLRERLTTGATGRISEEILTTLGAAWPHGGLLRVARQSGD
jgi:hypothetical protein